MATGVDGQPGAPAVQPAVKATRQDPGCVTTLRLSLKAIYAKGRLLKCRCAKETDPNARAPIKEQVSCHFYWGFVTRVLSSPKIWPLSGEDSTLVTGN